MALKELLTDLSSYFQDYPLHNQFNQGQSKVANGIFNQKSLEFGKGRAYDQPKGGFSKQPYITVPIPKGDDNYKFKVIGNLAVGGEGSGVLETINTVTSGLIRGGVVTAGIHSAVDALRLSKFGIDLKRGIPFIAKQIGLQLSNVKIGGLEEQKSPPFLNNNRIYNLGINTLSQTAANAFGIHFKRHGLYPQTARGVDDETGYYAIVKENNREDNEAQGNRLLILKNYLLEKDPQDRKELYNYPGGPGSVYGIGKTTLRSYTNTINSPKLQRKKEYIWDKGIFRNITGTYDEFHTIDYSDWNRFTKKLIGDTTKVNPSKTTSNDLPNSVSNLYNYLTLDKRISKRSKVSNEPDPSNPSISGNPNSPDSSFSEQKSFIGLNKLTDFRASKAAQPGVDPRLKTYYQNISSNYGEGGNMESRLGIGTGFDKMAELAIIRNIDPITYDDYPASRDLIKFFIEAIDSDHPGEKDTIFFRAFLDSFHENYRAKWKSFNFIGNPEPFFNYNSFDRSVSLSFKIAAFRREELRPLYIKLNGLISQLMPDYSTIRGAGANTRARAPYVRLTVGSYLDKQPGFIESLGIKWDKNYPWEIGIIKSTGEVEKSGGVQVLPHILDIDMKFQPIHSFVPRKVKPSDPDVPFITLNSRNASKESKDKVWIGKDDNFDVRPEVSKAQEKRAVELRKQKERIAKEKKIAENAAKALEEAKVEEAKLKARAALDADLKPYMDLKNSDASSESKKKSMDEIKSKIMTIHGLTETEFVQAVMTYDSSAQPPEEATLDNTAALEIDLTVDDDKTPFQVGIDKGKIVVDKSWNKTKEVGSKVVSKGKQVLSKTSDFAGKAVDFAKGLF